VAGRQGGGREIMRDEGDNECNSETNKQKNGFEECQAASGTRPENVSPQKLKWPMKYSDYVCDKLHPPFL
jgi:hypothetical protein